MPSSSKTRTRAADRGSRRQGHGEQRRDRGRQRPPRTAAPHAADRPPRAGEQDFEITEEDIEFVRSNPVFARMMSATDGNLHLPERRVGRFHRYAPPTSPQAPEGDDPHLMDTGSDFDIDSHMMQQDSERKEQALARKRQKREDAVPVAVPAVQRASLPDRSDLPRTWSVPVQGIPLSDEEDADSQTGEPATKKQKRALPIVLTETGKVVKRRKEIAVGVGINAPAPQRAAEIAEIRPAAADALPRKRLSLQHFRQKIAVLCESVLSDHKKPFTALNELLDLCAAGSKDGDRKANTAPETAVPAKVVAWSIVSAARVFCDICPGYRVQERYDDSGHSQLTNDVRRLREFEQNLLKAYRRFLSILGTALSTQPAAVARAAGMCLTSLPHFNDYQKLFPPALHSAESSTWLERLVSEPSLVHTQCTVDFVQALSRRVKTVMDQSKCDLLPSALIDTLLQFTPSFVLDDPKELAAKEKQKKKEKYILEKHQAKTGKDGTGATLEQAARRNAEKTKHKNRSQDDVDQEQLEKDLRESDAVVTAPEKKAMEQRILEAVFVLYFRILRNPVRPARVAESYLRSAFAGIRHFGQYMNVDLLMESIDALLDMSSADGAQSVSLRCASVLVASDLVFHSSALSAVSVDYQRMISALFDLLTALPLHPFDAQMLSEVSQASATVFGSPQIVRQLGLQRAAALVRQLLLVCSNMQLYYTSLRPLSVLLETCNAILAGYPALAETLFADLPVDAAAGSNTVENISLTANVAGAGAAAVASNAFEISLLAVRHFHPRVRSWAKALLDAEHQMMKRPAFGSAAFPKPIGKAVRGTKPRGKSGGLVRIPLQNGELVEMQHVLQLGEDARNAVASGSLFASLADRALESRRRMYRLLNSAVAMFMEQKKRQREQGRKKSALLVVGKGASRRNAGHR